jgi:3-dehydroquinate synthase
VVGGGAVLDMVSFAAAIAHRGIRVVRIPTTVLSQGDSAVGVKNSVNLFGKKNFIGTFVPPFAVINDPEFFRSLEPRDRIAGVVEAIKVALLKDPAFYQYLETHADQIAEGDVDVLAAITRRSAELHLAHICGNGDPFELGSARPLDFGHWAAHKLESMTGHRLRHGEAVAIGIALDLAYSVRMGYLARPCATRIMDLLEAVGFRLWDEALLERDASGQLTLIRGLQEFREHLGGELTVTLLRGIGQSFEVTEMDADVVAESLELLAPAIEPALPRLRGAAAAGGAIAG